MTFGQIEGDICFRDDCQGVIVEDPSENCSCHTNPPCGSCVTDRSRCPKCDWLAKDEVEVFNGYVCKINPNDRLGAYESWKPRPLDPRKLDYHSLSHSNSSMIKRGVYPPEMTQAEVLKEVKGTFGGRFNYFKDGKFEYVAYTD